MTKKARRDESTEDKCKRFVSQLAALEMKAEPIANELRGMADNDDMYRNAFELVEDGNFGEARQALDDLIDHGLA